jgi:hypothetical protein
VACQPLHTRDCENPECDGCRFRETGQGLNVCDGCERRSRDALRELAGLYAGLLERPAKRGGGRSVQVDPPEPLPAGAIEARWDIETLIDRWTTIVTTGRGLTRPALEAVTVAQKRAWANQLRLAALSRLNGQHVDARRHLANAATLKHDLDTGAHWIGHRADLIDRHALWILASTHAVPFVHQVLHVRDEARHPADPPADQEPRTVPREEPLTLVELRTWLNEHGITVTDHQLRHWADDHKIVPTNTGGKGIARTYNPHAAYLTAASLAR